MRINCHCHVSGLLESAGQGTYDILLSRIWSELSGHYAESSGQDPLETAANMLRFVAIGHKSSKAILASLMKHGGSEDIYVPLQIDFNNALDKYEAQKLVLEKLHDDFPQRVLPFVGYHGARDGAETSVREALQSHKFFGVKCYPSLGYKMSAPKTRPLLQYCAANKVPLMTHCAPDGFHKSENSHLASPAEWRQALQDHPGLKICFGHFGSENELLKFDDDAHSWTRQIVDFMRAYPGQVFADISCHSKPIIWQKHQPQKYRQYVKKLKSLLNEPDIRQQILWGTDFYMNHLTTTEDKFIAFWQREFFCSDPQLKRAMCEDNPQKYLGL